MDTAWPARARAARDAALEVLYHNARGPHGGLPRTAAWGYPEPYTRDLMISALGILASGDAHLIETLRAVLVSLAEHQTALGHIPSLAHDAHDRGASDTTPLFLLALVIFRRVTGEADFLADAADKALTWMAYQSPGDQVLVGQLPTSDWRDEQWVLGYGLFVNIVVYLYLRLYGQHERAAQLRDQLRHFVIRNGAVSREPGHHAPVPRQPYYALWAYKIYTCERFDLLGNSLAVISGITTPTRETALVNWIEHACEGLRARGELAVDVPPCLFPYIRPGDADWRERYGQFNRPGEYHNGGIWPFIVAFYVVAVLAAGKPRLAEKKLMALTDLVTVARDDGLAYGFNEWHRAQDGTPQGNDWQTWSAAMYLYAAACVEQGRVLFFEELRG